MKFYGLCKGIKEMKLANTFETNMYEGRFSLLYDSIVSNALDDVNYFLRLANLYGKNILELGCGSGRIIYPMLKHRINMTGVDLSRDMLNICEAKCSELENKPKLIHGDMCTYASPDTYDIVILTETSLCLVSDQDDRVKLFNNVYKSLKNGGVFVFNYNDNELEKTIETHPYYYFNPIERSFCIVNEKYDDNRKVYNVNIYLEDIDEDGKTIRYITSTEKNFLSRSIVNDITKRTPFIKLQENSFDIAQKKMIFEVLLKNKIDKR